MTKKEKKEEALRLRAEIDAKKGIPKKNLTFEERKEKRQWEIRRKDNAKNRSSTVKQQLEAEKARLKWMNFDKW